jgi:hypothetical protein
MGRTLGARQKRQNYSIPWVASVGDLVKRPHEHPNMRHLPRSYFVFKKHVMKIHRAEVSSTGVTGGSADPSII